MSTLRLSTLTAAALVAHAAAAHAGAFVADDPHGEVAKLGLDKAAWVQAANAGCHPELAGTGLDHLPRDVGQRMLAIENALGLPCFAKPGTQTKALYLRENKPTWGSAAPTLLDEGYGSELIRVFVVERCLPRGANGKLETTVTDKLAMGVFAQCEHDIAALDQSALEAEIAGPGFTDFLRARARDEFAHAKADGDRLRAAYAAAAKSNPAIQKYVFDVPEQAWATWTTAYGADQPAVDGAHAQLAKILTDVAGRGVDHPETSCAALHDAVAAHAAKAGGKTETDALAAATDVVGWRLLEAASLCDAYAGNMAAMAVEDSLMRMHGTLFGPRSYATTLLIGLLQDDAQAPYAPADLKFTGTRDWLLEGNFYNKAARGLLPNDVDHALADPTRMPTGQISAIAKVPGGVQVSFKKSSVQIPDLKCGKERIVNFDANWQPIYYADCVTVGYHSQDTSQPPILMTAELAAHLEVGELMQFFAAERHDNTHLGYPVRVWSAPDRKQLVMLYGVPVAIVPPPVGK